MMHVYWLEVSRRRIYVANILIVHFGMELKKYTSIQLEHLTIYPFESTESITNISKHLISL